MQHNSGGNETLPEEKGKLLMYWELLGARYFNKLVMPNGFHKSNRVKVVYIFEVLNN